MSIRVFVYWLVPLFSLFSLQESWKETTEESSSLLPYRSFPMCRSRVQRFVVIWQRSSISSIFSRVIFDLLLNISDSYHLSVPLACRRAAFRSRVGIILYIIDNRYACSFFIFFCAFTISSYALFISLEGAVFLVFLGVDASKWLEVMLFPSSSQMLSISAPSATYHDQSPIQQASSLFLSSISIVTSYSYSK